MGGTALKKIILTGGGTAGHVTPNIALIPELQKRDYEIYYIGSKDGIETKLMADFDIPYYGISVEFFSKIRDEKKFGSLEELRAAIADDQLKAKQILGLRI